MVNKTKTEALDSTLSLVARGNAVLAEIERLSDAVPLLFRFSRSNFLISFDDDTEFSRGEIRSEESQVIFDFSYFKNIDGVEAAVDKNTKLQEIDARVKEEHLEILQKFYKVTDI